MSVYSYHKPETNPSSSAQSSLHHIKDLFASAFKALSDFLLTESNTEPEITKLQGQDGEVFWKIYDTTTGKTVYCMTESEVMEWLDTCQYRQ